MDLFAFFHLLQSGFTSPIDQSVYLWILYLKNQMYIDMWTMSVSPIQFHWSMCLLLCQYHAVFIAKALWYNLRPGNVIPPAVLLLFRIISAVLYFSVFPYKSEKWPFKFCEEFVLEILIPIKILLYL